FSVVTLASVFRRAPRVTTLVPYTTLLRSLRHRVRDVPHVLVGTAHAVRDHAGARARQGGRPLRLHRALRERPGRPGRVRARPLRSEEHTSELQSRENLVCRLLLETQKSGT